LLIGGDALVRGSRLKPLPQRQPVTLVRSAVARMKSGKPYPAPRISSGLPDRGRRFGGDALVRESRLKPLLQGQPVT